MKLSGCDGISFELTITGYEFPDIEQDIYDADWLNVHTKVSHPLGSWSAQYPCLFTYEVEWLARWLEKIASHPAVPDTRFFTEPNLAFSLFSKNDGEQMLQVNLSHEMAPPWLGSEDEAIEGLSIDFRLRELDLTGAAQSLCEALKRYPPRGEYALWLTSEAYYQFQPLFAEGMKLRTRGQYEEAIVLFEHALEEAPQSDETKPFDSAWLVRAKYELAFCFFRLAEQGDAALYAKTENILQAIDLQAKGLTIREEIIDLWGHLLVKQGRYSEALLKFEELIKTFPTSRLVEDCWYMLGWVSFQLGRPEEGRGAFQSS